jgi:hypothetical protein
VETLILPAFIVWLGLAIIIGVAANTRGRNGGGWFILATFISPLIDREARECPTTGPKHSVGLVILLRVDQHWRSGIAPLVHECFTRNGS